jgi:isocitrate/isopropylmalate dehydrogenase
MKAYNTAVIAGDGIGREVVPESIRVLEAAGKRIGFHAEKISSHSQRPIAGGRRYAHVHDSSCFVFHSS